MAGMHRYPTDQYNIFTTLTCRSGTDGGDGLIHGLTYCLARSGDLGLKHTNLWIYLMLYLQLNWSQHHHPLDL